MGFWNFLGGNKEGEAGITPGAPEETPVDDSTSEVESVDAATEQGTDSADSLADAGAEEETTTPAEGEAESQE